jgi:hypothetical protein
LNIIDKIKTKFGQWDPMGRVVLIKSILLAIPIYQYSAMLAPVGIMNQINLNIRKILWQGGKSNTKKYHLINWKTVRVPKDRG